MRRGGSPPPPHPCSPSSLSYFMRIFVPSRSSRGVRSRPCVACAVTFGAAGASTVERVVSAFVRALSRAPLCRVPVRRVHCRASCPRVRRRLYRAGHRIRGVLAPVRRMHSRACRVRACTDDCVTRGVTALVDSAAAGVFARSTSTSRHHAATRTLWLHAQQRVRACASSPARATTPCQLPSQLLVELACRRSDAYLGPSAPVTHPSMA